MFSFILWPQFFIIIAGFAITYYFLIAIIYYRTEIKTLLNAKPADNFKLNHHKDSQTAPLSISESNSSTSKDLHINGTKIHELMADLKSLFISAAKTKTIKEELIMALQMLLREYSALKELQVAEDINHNIMSECQNICSITLSEAEMKMLWNG
jgi:hypothetical protein